MFYYSEDVWCACDFPWKCLLVVCDMATKTDDMLAYIQNGEKNIFLEYHFWSVEKTDSCDGVGCLFYVIAQH